MRRASLDEGDWNYDWVAIISNPRPAIGDRPGTSIIERERTMHIIRNATSTILAAVFAFSMMVVACFAASPFEGAWKVTDTAGKPFEITLSADSKASASRGEGMVGTWKEEGNAAVIKWNTGWTTKITKDGDHYKKAAFGKGQPLDGPPANTSDAEKVK